MSSSSVVKHHVYAYLQFVDLVHGVARASNSFYLWSRELIEGVEVLNQIEAVSTYNERPLSECLIVDCGILNITKLP